MEKVYEFSFNWTKEWEQFVFIYLVKQTGN